MSYNPEFCFCQIAYSIAKPKTKTKNKKQKKSLFIPYFCCCEITNYIRVVFLYYSDVFFLSICRSFQQIFNFTSPLILIVCANKQEHLFLFLPGFCAAGQLQMYFLTFLILRSKFCLVDLDAVSASVPTFDLLACFCLFLVLSVFLTGLPPVSTSVTLSVATTSHG